VLANLFGGIKFGFSRYKKLLKDVTLG